MPTTLAYTSYLLRSCHQGSFAEGLAAVLPCYWIYAEVGTALLARGSPDPLYARWIATYGGEEFGRIVADVLAVVDRVGERQRRGAGRHARARRDDGALRVDVLGRGVAALRPGRCEPR